MSGLERKLADAAVRRNMEEEDDGYKYPWPPGAWQEATDAILNGTYKPRPPRRYPVLLTPDSPVHSASQLQQLVETQSPPPVTVTSQVDFSGQEIRKVTICDIGFEECKKLEEKAELSLGIADDVTVMFEGKRRSAMTVKALKEGITLKDDGDEEAVKASSELADRESGHD